MPSKTAETRETWIQKTPAICGGAACIRDTRIPVWSIIRAEQLGASVDKPRTYFVTPLTAADVRAAQDYYTQNGEEIDEEIRLNEEA